jgi:hypothetical protein
MKIVKRVIPLGHSSGVVLDKIFLRSAGVKCGDIVELEVTKVISRKVRKKQ